MRENGMNLIKSEKTKLKARRTFIKKGTCSRTFFHLLNKEFGHPMEDEECAIDPLAGGIMQQGYQCGMLWGASMAIAAEANRRTENPGMGVALSINVTQYMMESFVNRTKSIECEEITNADFNNKWSFAKYMFSGKFISCFSLAGKWAPEALQSAIVGLSKEQPEGRHNAISCASEVVKKMGGSEEESAMVAGFAGGLGLSGNGCGALAAAIWLKSLRLIREENLKTSYNSPVLDQLVNIFMEATDYEMECHKICNRHFKSVEEHTTFIKSGGCSKLICLLAQS